MNLREANFQVERLSNELNRLLKDKEVLEAKVGIQSVDPTKLVVDGGKRVDRLVEYVSSKEIKDLDDKIVIIQDKIKNLMDWIDAELKILKKYDKVEQLIVYYKEVDSKEYTWAQISRMVNYSMPHCKRIYGRYKKRRNF